MGGRLCSPSSTPQTTSSQGKSLLLESLQGRVGVLIDRHETHTFEFLSSEGHRKCIHPAG
jgi:hypothetical protein